MSVQTQNYKAPVEVRASAILTTSYVAGTVIDTSGLSGVASLYVDFTKGSLTTAEIKVEFSPNNTDYFHETYEPTPTAGVTVVDNLVRQLDATGMYRFLIPIKDRFIKVSVKGTGTVTSSLMDVQVALG